MYELLKEKQQFPVKVNVLKLLALFTAAMYRREECREEDSHRAEKCTKKEKCVFSQRGCTEKIVFWGRQ